MAEAMPFFRAEYIKKLIDFYKKYLYKARQIKGFSQRKEIIHFCGVPAVSEFSPTVVQ